MRMELKTDASFPEINLVTRDATSIQNSATAGTDTLTSDILPEDSPLAKLRTWRRPVRFSRLNQNL